MTTPTWHQDALCRYAIRTGYALPDDWYAPATEPEHHTALTICSECPVTELCAMQGDDERYGIWGGKYRDKYPKADPADPIVHGTEAGASRHRRRNEKPCRECQDAANRANQTRKEAVA